jgi:hypothetical protein
MARTYSLRKIPNGRGNSGKTYYTYAFTVPPAIAEVVPEDKEFTVHMDDSGIHFIPVGASPREVPAWAQNGQHGKPERKT